MGRYVIEEQNKVSRQMSLCCGEGGCLYRGHVAKKTTFSWGRVVVVMVRGVAAPEKHNDFRAYRHVRNMPGGCWGDWGPCRRRRSRRDS